VTTHSRTTQSQPSNAKNTMASLASESKDGATSTTMYKIGVVGCTGAVRLLLGPPI
jgi:hypothetical protein